MRVSALLVLSASLGLATAANAQQLAGGGDLAAFIPTFFGSQGLNLQTDIPHSAHFESQTLTNIGAFNTAFASQLTSLPLPSPASGFTYSYDSSTGVFKRSTESFGPILADRAETIGKNRFSLGFSYQHFDFDSLGGVNLSSLPSVFQHAQFQINGSFPAFEQDVVATVSSVSAKLEQFTPAITYGIVDGLDLAVALPFSHVDLSMSSVAQIVKYGSGPNNDTTHFFPNGTPMNTYPQRSESASGFGDMLLRLKALLAHGGSGSLALGVEGRLPTGSARNLLGSGAWGVEPFLIYSYAGKSFAPHVKVAYQWNGDSILGGASSAQIDPNTHRVTGLLYNSAALPRQLLYNAGADLGVAKTVTLALDLIGRRVVNGPELQAVSFNRQTALLPNEGPLPNTQVVTGSYFVDELSAGLKWNAVGKLLVDLNVLLSLDHNGLHHQPTPLLGIEYGF
jgi:hypothetical protein